MTVSVALATYNGEKYITEQLDSLLGQTVRPEEVIIIDDCSTDRTPDIIGEYIASHKLDWRFSRSEKNSGYKRNFYNCLKECTGDVVFLCDQDDVWHKEKIEKMTAVFQNDPDCLAVNSSFDMIDGEGTITVPFGSNERHTANFGLMPFQVDDGACIAVGLNQVLVYNISPGCTCAFKRSVVEEYIKSSQCAMPHDWELNVIAAKNSGLRFLNLPLTGYRQHGGNTIGLSVDDSFGPLKMRGTDDVRLKVLQLQKAQADMVKANFDVSDKKQARFCKRLERFCRNREKILLEKRFFPCIKNIVLYPSLKSVATIHFRGIIGDMVYVLKSK